MEGSADWFSTLALPAAPFIAGRVSRFDADSPRTALNLMTYDAFVFFAWMGGARGVESVMPFLHGMAESSAVSAQQAAMRGAMPAPAWLQFAEDYLDRQIRDGHGASIGSTPEDGDCAAIPLGGRLPCPSSDQAGRRAGTWLICRPYSVLHPAGFTVPAALP